MLRSTRTTHWLLWLRFSAILSTLGALVYVGVVQGQAYYKKSTRPIWRLEEVNQGDIVFEVNATGSIKPVLSVSVGSFVSGPVIELNADFNDEVTEGQILAVIDPLLFDANVARDKANLASRVAEVARVEAQLQQAINDEQRSIALRKENRDYISDAEMDQFKYARLAHEAQLKFAEASVQQAEASLSNSTVNLEYTKIRSPVNGFVIDRKIDPGQTLASQFQTPELFIVAPDMREKMHVFASVDEADIGLIREAQIRDQSVRFRVDAYPETSFSGKIEQIRFSSEESQNVVTYPVIVAAANPDLKLLPGMTANLSFQIEERKDVVRIPNAALRYLPDEPLVRKQDQEILSGVLPPESPEEQSDQPRSVSEHIETAANQTRRFVWIVEKDAKKGEEKLRAVEVKVGISDHKYTEMVQGALKPGDKLVVGLSKKRPQT